MKILSIEPRMVNDDYPDLSYLGEFGSSAGNWHVNRATGELIDPDGQVAAVHPSGGVNVDHGCFRTFDCGSNHVPHKPKNWNFAGCPIPILDQESLKVAIDWHLDHHNDRDADSLQTVLVKYGTVQNADYQYTLADWRRFEDYRTTWECVGVAVVARYLDDQGDVQVVQSYGLWGVESDSGKEYFREVVQGQLSELTDILISAGFTKLEILQKTPEYLDPEMCDRFTSPEDFLLRGDGEENGIP